MVRGLYVFLFQLFGFCFVCPPFSSFSSSFSGILAPDWTSLWFVDGRFDFIVAILYACSGFIVRVLRFVIRSRCGLVTVILFLLCYLLHVILGSLFWCLGS